MPAYFDRKTVTDFQIGIVRHEPVISDNPLWLRLGNPTTLHQIGGDRFCMGGHSKQSISLRFNRWKIQWLRSADLPKLHICHFVKSGHPTDLLPLHFIFETNANIIGLARFLNSGRLQQ